MKKMISIIVLCICCLFSSCTYRLSDNLIVVKAKGRKGLSDLNFGRKVEGNAYYPYLIGYNLNDAVDRALKKAGPDYDMLINATIDFKHYYLLIYYSQYVIVKGTAVNSTRLREKIGQDRYSSFLMENYVYFRK